MVQKAQHGKQEMRIGDTIRVHQKIEEGGKSRTQVFEGTLISIRGEGSNKSFMVRRIGTGGIGVERIFPLVSPIVQKIEIVSGGVVRRAKLYYLREKSAREVADITRRRSRRKAKTAPKKKVKRVPRKTSAPKRKAPQRKTNK